MALECSVGSLSDSTNTQGKHTHDTVVQTLFVNLVWRGSCVKGKATRYQNINSIWQSACVCSWFVCSWFEKSVSDEDCWRPWNQSHLWHSLKLSAALSLRRSDRGGVWRGQGVSVQVNTKKMCKTPKFLDFGSCYRYASVCLCMCRSQAVVSVEAEMILTPKILNPDDQQCHLPQMNIMVTW